MTKIFVDFEMQPIYQKQDNIPEIGAEIIEIGAAAMDENLVRIASYQRYVRPRYSQLTKNISKLTGISNANIAKADSFSHVISDFANWCNGMKDYQILAWSSADFLQVSREIKAKNVQDTNVTGKFLFPWLDFQKEFSQGVGAASPLSLSKALEISGLSFQGHHHDALDDATNTGILYKESCDPEKYQEMKRQMNCYMTDSAHHSGITIGDLFNFKSLTYEFS